MGTHCTIKVENVNYCKLYKHYDGYQESTLPWLLDFNERFINHRGKDPEYKMAQLVRDSLGSSNKFSLDPSLYTGWGIVDFNADVDPSYEYILQEDGSIYVYEFEFDVVSKTEIQKLIQIAHPDKNQKE